MDKKEYKRRKRIWNRKWREGLKRKRDEEWGNKCSVCGSIIHLLLHEKKGVRHRGDTGFIVEALRHPERYVRLCMKCHIGVHFCMEFFGWTWDEIVLSFRNRETRGSIPLVPTQVK